ncbi:MAG: UxaA family hydrolase [Thermoprotei archaeon]
MEKPKAKALAHAAGDSVAVAVKDIKAGEDVFVAFLDESRPVSVKAISDVPLGHKISLVTLRKGEDVIEYGRPIGYATRNIGIGEHVHVHNVKSKRW